MGHQESYVRVSDNTKFQDLVDLTKRLDKDFFWNNDIMPVEIITLNQAIEGNLKMMCMEDKTYKFEVGEKFIYFTGQRSGQRSPACMYEDNAPKDLEIYFTECFPSCDIFDKNKNYATHKEFIWD